MVHLANMSETCENSRDGDSSSKFPRSKSLHAPLVKNPFVHRLGLTTRDKIQVAIMSVTIVPLRLAIMVVFLLIGWFCAYLTLLGWTEEDQTKPMKGWRRLMKKPVWLAGRGVMFAVGFQYIRVKGKRARPMDAPLLVVAPHSTFLDAIVMFGLSHVPGMVSRVENSKIPLVGTLTTFAQPVLVSREDPNSRQNTIKEINKRAHSGGAWPHLLIFPEGTCTNRSCLIAFKPGAFYPGVPVQPVCVRFNNRLDTITWTWDGPGVLEILWYTLCQFNTNVEIEFLDVHVPTEEEKKDPKLYARNVRYKMAKCLNIPTTDHTFEDCRLMLYASKMEFPAASALVEFQKLSKKLGMSFDNLKDLLEKFTAIAQKNKGHVTVEEFASYLDLPVSDTLRDMFSIYDRDGSGTIDFREYVIGLHLVAKPANREEVISLAFQVFDSGNKGYITETELSEILHNAFGMDQASTGKLFSQVDKDADGKITFDEFKEFAEKRPEYARLFMTYQQLQGMKTEEEILRQAEEWGNMCSVDFPNAVDSKVKEE